MGIVHFAGVGTSPGAVTSPLAYLKHHPECFPHEGAIVESLVVFCSHDVYAGDRVTEDYFWNGWGRTGARQDWQKPRRMPNVIEVIHEFLSDARNGVLLEGGHFFVWPVDVQNYDACFEAIAKATIALARGTDQGKLVWANLTGGTNVLNAALMQVTLLSGLIGRMYYAFIAHAQDRNYLLPFTNDEASYRLDEIPGVKTDFDENYYRVLRVLRDWLQEGLDTATLLSFLKDQDAAFASVDATQLVTQYLNRMNRKEIVWDVHELMRLSPSGQAILTRIEQPLFQGLVKRAQNVPEELVADCKKELIDKIQRLD